MRVTNTLAYQNLRRQAQEFVSARRRMDRPALALPLILTFSPTANFAAEAKEFNPRLAKATNPLSDRLLWRVRKPALQASLPGCAETKALLCLPASKADYF